MKTKGELISEKLLSKSEVNSDFNYRLYLDKDSLKIYPHPIILSSYLEISGKKVNYQAYYNVDNEHYNLLMKKK